MNDMIVTAQDRAKARGCLSCAVCAHARRTQGGLAYWFVKSIEGGFCPQCKAFFKVYGFKAHEALPADFQP